MDRTEELERVLEEILTYFEDEQVETNGGDLVFISLPLAEALADAEDILYSDGEDGPDGTF